MKIIQSGYVMSAMETWNKYTGLQYNAHVCMYSVITLAYLQ
jgi:hypothetical protein